MGHALADDVVEGQECPPGTHRRPQGGCHPPGQGPHGVGLVLGEVGQGRHMEPGDDQGVAGKEGPVVEEGEHLGLLGDPMGRDLTVADTVKDARWHGTPEEWMGFGPRSRDHAGMSHSAVPFTAGPPETILDPPAADVAAALAAALAAPPGQRLAALAPVAAAHPRFLAAWAGLADAAGAAGDAVASYAYARVGYHRGLDQLRASGWRGSGYVRWVHETNRGFLGSVDALRRAAVAIGEADEAARCELFLAQLDPDWSRSGPESPT